MAAVAGSAVGNTTAAVANSQTAQTPDDQVQDTALDRHKQRVDSRVQRASRWVDSFFSDPNYEEELATSLIRVRPELFTQREQGLKLRARASLKLSLPNIDRKISLFAGNGPDDGNLGESTEDGYEDSVIGLQFFGREKANWHFSNIAGVKFNRFALFLGPRIRYSRAFSEKNSFRFTQALVWQTNNHWQIRSRLDLNHAFSDQLLFRETIDGRHRGEKSGKEGYRTRISSFLTQRLHNQAGLQYEFSTVFNTRPDTRVNRYTLALRYRKQFLRDWLYYEIVPQLSFDHQFDYKTNPGVHFRMEIFYGDEEVTDAYKHHPEDNHDFRW